MAQRKTHPDDAIPRRCEVCGFVTMPLTDREWLAKRPSHVLSIRHQDAVKKKLGSEQLTEKGGSHGD